MDSRTQNGSAISHSVLQKISRNSSKGAIEFRVAIVTHEFPPYIFGGIGMFSHSLAEALVKQGVDVLVLSGSDDRHPKREASDGMEVVRLPRGPFPPRHLWFQLRNMNTIRRELATCDIVHGQDCAAFPLLGSCRRSGLKLPWVITFHTNPVTEMRLTLASIGKGGSLTDVGTYLFGFPLWDLTVRSHTELADHLVAVSESLRAELSHAYKLANPKMSVVHTGVNTARISEMIGDQDFDSTTKIRLFYAGRLYYRKGISHLLKIIIHVFRDLGVHNFRLEVFGRGPLEEPLRRFIARHDLGTLVTLRGYVRRETLLSSLAASDIVCLPSLYEACPVLMIEAMSLAKPVVAFDLPFAREILGESCSTLLASSGLDYARILARLIESEEDRTKLGHLVRSRADDFDVDKIASSYIDIYKNLMR